MGIHINNCLDEFWVVLIPSEGQFVSEDVHANGSTRCSLGRRSLRASQKHRRWRGKIRTGIRLRIRSSHDTVRSHATFCAAAEPSNRHDLALSVQRLVVDMAGRNDKVPFIRTAMINGAADVPAS